MLQKFNMTLFAAVLALFAVSISASPDTKDRGPLFDDTRSQYIINQGDPSFFEFCPGEMDESCRITILTRKVRFADNDRKERSEWEEIHEICRDAGFDAAATLFEERETGDLAVECADGMDQAPMMTP